MKRMILIISILSIFILTAKGPDDNRLVIIQAEKIMPYGALSRAIDIIETNCDTFAIGDKNLKSWSYGIKQIRQVRLDHYFELTGIRYTVEDMFDPVKADKVFMYFAHQIGPYDLERVARNWNGKWELTEGYWKRIQKHL